MKEIFCIVQYEDEKSDFYKVLIAYESELEAKQELAAQAINPDIYDDDVEEDEVFYNQRWEYKQEDSWGLVRVEFY